METIGILTNVVSLNADVEGCVLDLLSFYSKVIHTFIIKGAALVQK